MLRIPYLNGIFKLIQGSDCNPKSLPMSGENIRKIPRSQRKCLTQEEAQTVYECLAAEQVVSPIHFNKEIAKAPNLKKLAYQKLEEILEEEGSVNPYQLIILSREEEDNSQDPFLHINFIKQDPPA